MVIARTTLVLVIFLFMFSVFVANISNIISVNDRTSDYVAQMSLRSSDVDHIGPKRKSVKESSIMISNSSKHLLWFVQISDIHISIFQDPSRVSELKEFCDLSLEALKPAVVLASGDLTDAKTDDNMGSRQIVQEWQMYRNLLKECHVHKKTLWLDIRGNHDNFNVLNLESKENYYRNYSIQGVSHPRSYLHQISKGGDKYSFIGVDACLEPGPRRPFNFVGMLRKNEMEHVRNLSEEAHRQGSNYTIWFGHYPTSCILTPGPGGVRALIGSHREGLVYLCGHYHTLGGMVSNMYTLQQAGFLELELGDWKDNRLYRVAAVDHGLFSFIDVHHRDWPVILITNPKHTLYKMPTREPLNRMRNSTHIRMLIFSLSHIVDVQVKVDEEGWRPCTEVKGPLYVAMWEPNKYAQGLHYIHVHVEDGDGRVKTITQPFSLDDTRLGFHLLPRFVLMSNISLVFQLMFGFMLVICVVPLCILRVLHILLKANKYQKPKLPLRCLQCWLQKLWILGTVDRIFYPLVLYALYLTVGPWSVGEVIEGYTGIIFAWGTIINGVYLPGSFTYAYGFLQMFTFQMPITLLLAHALDKRLRNHGLEKPCTMLGLFWHHSLFVVLIGLQMMFAYFFWLAYGTMAFLLGPLRSWSIVLAVVLWHQANTLPEYCLREAAFVWRKHHIRINLQEERPMRTTTT